MDGIIETVAVVLVSAVLSSLIVIAILALVEGHK